MIIGIQDYVSVFCGSMHSLFCLRRFQSAPKLSFFNWIVTGKVLSSDAFMVNADSIGTAVSLRQDDSNVVNDNISVDLYEILKFFISVVWCSIIPYIIIQVYKLSLHLFLSYSHLPSLPLFAS